jgi:hypothetical protein
MTNQIAKLRKYHQETRLEHKHLIYLLIGLQEGWLRHNWQVHNQYNDHFAQRRVTRLREK